MKPLQKITSFYLLSCTEELFLKCVSAKKKKPKHLLLHKF